MTAWAYGLMATVNLAVLIAAVAAVRAWVMQRQIMRILRQVLAKLESR